jgi:hypothetical protein
MKRLIAEITKQVRQATPRAREYALAPPHAGVHVGEQHLSLIHTCHRSKWFDADFGGVATYRWNLAVYGSKRTVDRIQHVTYYLHPAYEQPRARKPSHAVEEIDADKGRSNCFLLKQIANGHSLVRAKIAIKDQREPVLLTRYINLFHSRDRIENYLV